VDTFDLPPEPMFWHKVDADADAYGKIGESGSSSLDRKRARMMSIRASKAR